LRYDMKCEGCRIRGRLLLVGIFLTGWEFQSLRYLILTFKLK
jgi:hypothetical protein